MLDKPPCLWYIEAIKTRRLFLMIDKSIKGHEVLRYGKYVLDEQMFDGLDDRRMRVIIYERHVYYHKMVNGETVEFRKLDGYELDS